MNSREFELYKTWRERKYWRDLEKLQNDLANHGLASSGIRNKEEAWLKDEYETEVLREEAMMLDYQAQKAREKHASKVQQYTNYALVAGTVIAAFAAVFGTHQASSLNESINRPYLVIRTIEHSKLETSSPAYHKGEITEKYSIFIKNVGVLPAKVVDTTLDCPTDGAISSIAEYFGLGVIGNGEEGVTAITARENKETECKYIIRYVMPTDSSSTTPYETKYQLYLHSTEEIVPEGVWMK